MRPPTSEEPGYRSEYSMPDFGGTPLFTVESLFEALDSCPTPFHVVDRAARQLKSAGFHETTQSLADMSSQGYLARDGLLVAWRSATRQTERFHVVGAHTDSPNLRVQPNPDIARLGWSQLGVEIYGGVLLNSWLDRDLGIAGRVILKDGTAVLYGERRPLARVPQLAIHLDRDITERGLVLDRHQHMFPVWSTDSRSKFIDWLATVTNTSPSDIASFDAHLFDVTPATVLGSDNSLIASGRLDNQVSCWAAVQALIASQPSPSSTQVVVLYDHEEVGSMSTTGAAGPVLAHVTESLFEHTAGTSRPRYFDALTKSLCISSDNAHAIHPNYPDRHELNHAPFVNLGPALKMNSNQRYATSARTAQMLKSIAVAAGVPLQTFVSRNNMPCGSTIGPITSTALGIDTVDIGVPQLSMHSARELCGANDPGHLARLLEVFFQTQ